MASMKRSRGCYDKDELINAVRAVMAGEMTSLKAAEVYKVPAGTIRSHTNNSSLRFGAGAPSYLNSKEEDYLVELIIICESVGIRLTQVVLRNIIGQYIGLVTKNPRFTGKEPSVHWLRDFLTRRKSEIKMVKEKHLERGRRDGFTEEVRKGWFNKLKEVLVKNDLLHKPIQIWNVDESGFSDETQCEWVCVSADTQCVYEDGGGSGKQFTTVVVCGSAAGICLPPYTIYAAKNVNQLWCQKGPDRAQYKCSSKGWINTDLFVDWFQNLFLVETASMPHPILLLMDNLSSHISIKVIELALQHQVILLCLPPNTTHALQPLDVATLCVAKNKWRSLVSGYFRKTKRKTIRKMDFPMLLNGLYSTAFTMGPVSGGFRRAGIWPFNEEAMKDKVVRRNRSKNNTIMNYSSASDTLTALMNIAGLTNNDSTDTSDLRSAAQQVESSTSISSHDQLVDDDKDEDEPDSSISIRDEPLAGAKSSDDDHNGNEQDANEIFDVASDVNISNSNNSKPGGQRQLSPSSAVRSVISSCLRDKNLVTQSTSTNAKARARVERRYGEEITNGNLLDELKQKKNLKKRKL